jgi:phenylpyruvate tautomerase PptA (4-oxalocrotonate tautomerase family)
MPTHRIFHHKDAFSPAEKQTLAERITKVYTDGGLPAFYTVVLYIPFEKESFFVGGQQTDKFVRIVVQHIARNFLDNAAAQNFLDRYEQALAPSIKEKGFDWEVRHTLSMLYPVCLYCLLSENWTAP